MNLIPEPTVTGDPADCTDAHRGVIIMHSLLSVRTDAASAFFVGANVGARAEPNREQQGIQLVSVETWRLGDLAETESADVNSNGVRYGPECIDKSYLFRKWSVLRR